MRNESPTRVAVLERPTSSAGVLQGRFRRSTSLDESDACRRRVARAIARAKQGDREALRYLYVQYADNVYGYVASIVKDEHEAEDITQMVFAKLMTKLAQYEQRQVPFTSWLLRLAHNAALDHLRRRLPTPAEEVRSPDERVDGRPRTTRRWSARRSRRCPRISAPSSCSATWSGSRPARSQSDSGSPRTRSTGCTTAGAGRSSRSCASSSARRRRRAGERPSPLAERDVRALADRQA